MKVSLVSLIILALCAVRTWAEIGAVLTADGRKLQGDLRITNDALVVKSVSGLSTVWASNIVRAQFSTNVIAAQTKGSGNGLFGVYYSTTNFGGPVFTRLDEFVDFNWQREPLFKILADNFTVRWMGYIQAPTTDNYTFYFGSDDGGRIYLDGKLVADHWNRRGFEETNVTVRLNAGERHKLTLEYLELDGPARAQLSWSTPSMPKTIVPQDRLYAASFDAEHQGDASGLAGSQGLLATYFNNDDFTSNSFSRLDPEIDFQWKGQPPMDGFSPKNFSVRWSGNVLVTNGGDYRFWVMCGAPMNLYINDLWISSPTMLALQRVVPAQLKVAERCELRLEMSITNNVVPVRLFWSGPGFEKTLLQRHHFSPAISPSRGAPSAGGPTLPAGIVLANGAIIGAPIVSASSTTIRLGGALEKQTLAVSRIARIHVKPLTTEMQMALPKGRSGVLLRSRDFIEGDFGGVENGKVKIDSVLFGSRTFGLAREVLVVALRNHEVVPWRVSVVASDGTVLYGKALRLATDRVGLKEITDIALPAHEALEINREN
jgi:hypothetical protein